MRLLLPAALLLAALLSVTPAGSAQGGRRAQLPPPPPKPLPSADELFERGRVEGSTYTNDFFGLSFSVPAGWTILDRESMKAARERAKALFRNETDPTVKRQLEESVERTTSLFSASRLPATPAGAFNAVLLCAAERVPTAIVKTPRDYYDLMMHSMKLSQGIDVVVVEPFRPRRIGATDFGTFTLRLKADTGIMMQKQIITVKSAYVLGIVYTYVEESDTPAFDKVISSIKTR